MSRNATFAVVVPAGCIPPEQFTNFEEACKRWNIPIILPLALDGRGNYVAAKGLSLREAQNIRQQISGLGYGVDVLSDALIKEADTENPIPDQASSTLLVELPSIQFSAQDDEDFDDNSSSMSSLQMPSLDLGLSSSGDIPRDLSSLGLESTTSLGGSDWMNLGDPNAINDSFEKNFENIKINKTNDSPVASFTEDMQVIDEMEADELLSNYGDEPMVELADVLSSSQVSMPSVYSGTKRDPSTPSQLSLHDEPEKGASENNETESKIEKTLTAAPDTTAQPPTQHNTQNLTEIAQTAENAKITKKSSKFVIIALVICILIVLGVILVFI